ncbi:hypothetical protein LB565_08480 [Mesorhizobium sp. CA14]|uniref:hypothetical protein n=1 Tax=Mesorhizobium sp. CA14 TaxID=2876642 RepID=UPI001CC9E55A|nr:hypothetical protein [Mesorhizobium sp. CA14]MBZ9848020.1 hypothetical protein [Mesorhizobium sp. CA14]
MTLFMVQPPRSSSNFLPAAMFPWTSSFLAIRHLPWALPSKRQAPRLGKAAWAATRHGEEGPTSKFVTVGFWIFLLPILIMFSALFAAYAVSPRRRLTD